MTMPAKKKTNMVTDKQRNSLLNRPPSDSWDNNDDEDKDEDNKSIEGDKPEKPATLTKAKI